MLEMLSRNAILPLSDASYKSNEKVILARPDFPMRRFQKSKDTRH
jgi:hypothetical protein